jgi:hypothetical protein
MLADVGVESLEGTAISLDGSQPSVTTNPRRQARNLHDDLAAAGVDVQRRDDAGQARRDQPRIAPGWSFLRGPAVEPVELHPDTPHRGGLVDEITERTHTSIISAPSTGFLARSFRAPTHRGDAAEVVLAGHPQRGSADPQNERWRSDPQNERWRSGNGCGRSGSVGRPAR